MALSFSVSVTGQTTVTLNWSMTGVTSGNYKWYIDFSGLGSISDPQSGTLYNVSSGSGSANVTGLTAATAYTWTAQVMYQNGNVTGPSATASGTTQSPPVTYTVTWSPQGGSVSPTSSTVNAGSSVTAPIPSRSGYSFSGWWTDPSAGSLVVDGGQSYTPSGSITLYAKWTANATYPPSWSDNTLGSAQTGVAYSDGVSATNMGYSGSYSVSSGSLPAGLSLNTSTGALTGTPTTSGSYNFTLTASNSYGSVSQAFTFVVSLTASGAMNVFDGTNFVQAPVYVYNGSTWVQAPVYVYNGSSWVMAV